LQGSVDAIVETIIRLMLANWILENQQVVGEFLKKSSLMRCTIYLIGFINK